MLAFLGQYAAKVMILVNVEKSNLLLKAREGE